MTSPDKLTLAVRLLCVTKYNIVHFKRTLLFKYYDPLFNITVKLQFLASKIRIRQVLLPYVEQILNMRKMF